jgi:hypothetical protein
MTLLARLVAVMRGDLVFVGERGAVMRSQTFQRAALTEAAEMLGIPGFHPARATAHGRVTGYRLGCGCEGRAADARPQVRDHDA